MTNDEAKVMIENLCQLQEAGEHFPCPRCGHKMKSKITHNALSRRAHIYICERCGMDEALLDATGRPPLPLNKWAMITETESE